MNADRSNGVLTWMPSEDQGPSTNTFTTVVTDDGAPNRSATNSFTVVVTEVNVAPALASLSDTTLSELVLYSTTASATDADVPANSLSFALISGPAGLTVSPSGLIAWTPAENQGPSTNLVTLKVMDNGSPNLSATQSFTLIVEEVNSPPVLSVQTDHTINELTTLMVTNTAADSDIPVNTLDYTLLAGPSGASISSNGVLTWTPSEDQGPSTNIFMTVVTDNGTPALSATNSFTVVVSERQSLRIFELVRIGNTFSVAFSTETGGTYVLQFKNSTMDPNWTFLPGSVVGDGSTQVLSDSTATGQERYYRCVRTE